MADSPDLGKVDVSLNRLTTVEPQCDPKDPDFARWYDTGTDSQGNPMLPIRQGNDVQLFIDGPDTFAAMVTAMKTATGGAGSGQFIYMCNWFFDETFNLVPGENLTAILTAASNAKVEIRALIWDQPKTQNGSAVKFIDGLANGGAVLDNRTLNFGTHHQKILVVNGSQGLIGFVGGVDFNPDRLKHVSDGAPLHDVHVRIVGPAVFDLLHTFVQRWQEHPDARKKGSPKFDLLGAGIPEPTAAGTAGDKFVQICRTFGNGARHEGIAKRTTRIFPLAQEDRGYGFLNGGSNGQQGIRQALIKAIGASKEFIYAEDQYMISMEISNLLKAQLPKIKKLILLITHSSISDLPGVWLRRKKFVDNLLTSPDKAKVAICCLHPENLPRNPKKVDPKVDHLYVHSKTWIFDDKFATVGSPNLNLRGWTHDSEIFAAIFDESKDKPCTLHFAHQLRMKLWAEHLKLKETDVFDPIASSRDWFSPPLSSRLMTYDHKADTDGSFFKPSFLDGRIIPDAFVDPNGS